MNFDHKKELLDWDMQTDENFDDVLRETHQNAENTTKRILNHFPSSSNNWVKFDQDYNHVSSVQSTDRRSGDGDSVTSIERGSNSNEHETKDMFIAKEQKKSFSNDRSKCSADLSRFTVLDEENNDLDGFDASPMEFRGTLTTDYSSYKNQQRTACYKAIRYLAIAMIALGIGILIGFYLGQSRKQQNETTTVSFGKFTTTAAEVQGHTAKKSLITTRSARSYFSKKTKYTTIKSILTISNTTAAIGKK